MTQPTQNRRGKRKLPAAPESAQEMSSGKLDQLRMHLERDSQILTQMCAIAGASPGAVAMVEAVRDRHQNNLQDTCRLLEARLSETEVRLVALEKENLALKQDKELLLYKNKKLLLELRHALGIRTSTADKSEPEVTSAVGASSATDQPTSRQQKKTGKRGAPIGHRGNTRKIPAKFDREEVIAPAERCSCGCSEVAPLDEFDMRYVEDLPPVCLEVTRQIYLQGRCQSCGKTVRHPDAVNRPPVVTGPNLAAHLTMLSQMGVTFRKLSHFSTKIIGIDLTASGALGIVNRVSAALEGPYNEILANLPNGKWFNGDETGWKVMGKSGYIWCFCNNDIAFFHHNDSRGAKVIEDLLGENFAGVVICDFYAAYNCINATQRCLVHLLRDIRKEREILPKSELLKRFEQAVKDFIEEGLRVQAMAEGDAKELALAKLEKMLDRLPKMEVTTGKATTLCKRIRKYRDNLIRFVTHPGVEFHNNRAERQLRPLVINRKVSFGSNTRHGARRYCILHTIIESCKLQNIDPFDYITRAYVSNGLDVPNLAGADPPQAVA